MNKTWWAAAVMAVASALAGCGGAGNTCVPGNTVECACPGGTKGVQTCQPDGTFGTCACGNTPTNSAPSAPVVQVSPASPTDAQDLVCSIAQASSDPNGDAVTYQFAWTKNGQPFATAVANATSSTVSADATAAGDVFACAASASDGKVSGPASYTVTATVQASTWPSCKALLTAVPGTPDGLYDIDPDGAGASAPVKVFCDMTGGGWTLVANIYDSAGDDAPNTTDYVVSGWQQTASGQWATAATKVERSASGTGSSAVSLAFVAALKASAGQQNLKMCFVHQNGTDTVCRSSADGTMTLVSYPTGNPKLTVYSGNTLPYTYGRLAGLAGSADGYDYSKYKSYLSGYPIPRVPGSAHDFGTENTGIGDYYNGSICACADGAWHGYGQGSSFKPADAANCELGSCAVGCQPGSPPACDPSTSTYGFRLYVGP